MSKKFFKLLAFVLVVSLTLSTPLSVLAEGSYEVHGDGSSVLSTDPDDRDSVPAEEHTTPWLLNLGETKKIMGDNIAGETVFRIYLQDGETLLFGAGLGNLDVNGYSTEIILKDPSGNKITPDADTVYSAGNLNDDLTEAERTALSWDSSKYNPHIYTATATGLYTLEFPGGKLSSDDLYTYYWDATVISGFSGIDDDASVTTLKFSGTEQTGRVFTQFLCISTGASGQPLPNESIYYILTNDGFVYAVDLSGIQPYGFYMFSDALGVQFADANGNVKGSAYQSYKANDNEGNQAADAAVKYGVADQSSFYRIFFNEPDDEIVNALKANGTLNTPAATFSITNFSFNGNNAVAPGVGGDFVFHSDVAGTYEIIIDFTNYTYGYSGSDNGGKVALRGIAVEGENTVTWDGKDANGNVVWMQDSNNQYSANISVKVGEVHVPLIDVENFGTQGISIALKKAPENYTNKVYYNNSNVGGADYSVNGDSSAKVMSNTQGDTTVYDLWTYAGVATGTEITIELSAYDVTYDVVNGSFAGNPNASNAADYEETLDANPQYKLPETITVTINGTEYLVTSGTPNDGITYDNSTGAVFIPKEKITGDIHVEAECVTKDMEVTINATNTTVSNETTSPEYGEKYNATIVANIGYAINSFEIEIGEDVYTVNSETGEVSDAQGNVLGAGDGITYTPSTGLLDIDGSKTVDDIVITVSAGTIFTAGGTVDSLTDHFAGEANAVEGIDYVATLTPGTGKEILVTETNPVTVQIGTDSYTIVKNGAEYKITDASDNEVTDITYAVNGAGVATVTVKGEAVTGNIWIEATTTAGSYSFTANVPNSTRTHYVEDVVTQATKDLVDGPFISYGQNYKFVFAPEKEGYALSTDVSVRIGDTTYKFDRTAESETALDGKITYRQNTATGEVTVTIAGDAVTGNIITSSRYDKKAIVVTKDFDGVEQTDETANLKYGDAYSITLAPQTGYDAINNVQVKFSGETYTVDLANGGTVTDSLGQTVSAITYNTSTGVLAVDGSLTTEDFEVIASAPKKCSVTYDLDGGTATGASEVTYKEGYTATLQPDANHTLPDTIEVYITNSEGGETHFTEGEDYTYDSSTGKIVINEDEILDDVTIVADFVPKNYTASGTVNPAGSGTYSGASEATYGTEYVGTVTPNTGYKIVSNITVEVGTTTYTINTTNGTVTAANGVDTSVITYAQNASTGIGTVKIAGEAVTGNIEITANCGLIQYNAEGSVTKGNYSGLGMAFYGTDYVGTITPNNGYEISGDITVTIGTETYTINHETKAVTDAGGNDAGNVIIYAVDSNGVGTVTVVGTSIDGDIEIVAICTAKSYSVTDTITNGDATGDSEATHGSDYTATIVPDSGYQFPDEVTVTINGTPQTVTPNADTASDDEIKYDDETGKVTIPGELITSDIVIEAECPAEKLDVDKVLSGVSASAETIDPQFGTDYTVTLQKDTGYSDIDFIQIKIGNDIYHVDFADGGTVEDANGQENTAITYDVATGKLDIDGTAATADIVITAKAPEIYGVTNTVTNGSYNGASEVISGNDYSETISADPNYELPEEITVKVTNGSGETTLTEGTDYTYDSTTGEVVVDKDAIDGDITITAVCEAKEYKAKGTVINGTYTGESTAAYGTDYVGTVTPNTGYAISQNLMVTIGAEIYTINYETKAVTDAGGNDASSVITYAVDSNGVGTVTVKGNAINGDIKIVATCSAKKYTVTDTITDGDATGDSEATYGSDYTATITPDSGYQFPDEVTVTINGTPQPVTPNADTASDDEIKYDDETGEITIPGELITGSVDITATCPTERLDVKKILTAVGASAETAAPDFNNEYTVTLKANSGYKFNSLTVEIGTQKYTVNLTNGEVTLAGTVVNEVTYNTTTGILVIDASIVTDDITVTAVAVKIPTSGSSSGSSKKKDSGSSSHKDGSGETITKAPETGDISYAGLYMLLMIISALSVAGLTVAERKLKN